VSEPLKLPSARGKLLQIAYTSPSFCTPQKVQFKYRLYGHDRDWIEAKGNRMAHYTNLRPGNYRFQAIARGAEGVWNYAGATIAFHLAPRWYETWMVFVGCGSLLIGFAAAVQHYRLGISRRLHRLEQERAIALERARIAQDMHDDLGSSLTRIKLLSEVTQLTHAEVPGLPEKLNQISKTTFEAIRGMDEIVWAINPRRNNLEDLAGYFGSYAEDFLRSSNIRCHFHMPPEFPKVGLSAEQRHTLFLVFKEVLHNVVKHARATEVWVAILSKNRSLHLEVRDNGRGIPALTGNSLRNGFANIQQRLGALGGTFHLKPAPEGGTEFSCEIQLP
jgi:signal transduction histidine kinase